MGGSGVNGLISRVHVTNSVNKWDITDMGSFTGAFILDVTGLYKSW